MKTYGGWVRRNCIGKGSFGVVSLAVDDSFTFAVKSVVVNSGELVRCLENEIRILKSLSSPYVVRYLGDDLTQELSTEYRNLHMEYMPGGTLADVAKYEDGSNIRSYTRCITAALSYIHARNVIHCDVKGANVLIGDVPGMAKLADFGSAIESGVPFPGTRGTPQWMAPEVIRGEYIGPESDVWSLGCTVIEMITGKPPWQDKGADTLRQIGYSGDLPELETPVSDDLRDFINKCLKREPSERWSCDQLLQHPFLLSCSSLSSQKIMIDDCKLSPRCVFDWSDSSSSKESTVDIYQFSKNRSSAKQRIGKLASNPRVNWESEGWEMVRHVTEEPVETTSEYSDSVDEEASGSGRVNWEDTERYDYDIERTSSGARGTMVGGMYRDSVNKYRCSLLVWIEKMFRVFILISLNAIRHVHYTEWFQFNATSSFAFKNFDSLKTDLDYI